MGDAGVNSPKGLITLGDKTIIEESISKLVLSGIAQVTVVTGFKAESYQFLESSYPQVRLIHNEHFAESGSMESLAQALRDAPSDFLLLDSDIIYETRGLHAMLEQAPGSSVLVSGRSWAGDEVWVSAENGRLTSLAKGATLPHNCAGEFVGITRVDTRLTEEMQRIAQKSAGLPLTDDYEEYLNVAAERVDIRVALVQDLVWAEIDDKAQLIRARNKVYPELRLAH
jgi:2-aminoethylphosphonate-pyruvate transaminase